MKKVIVHYIVEAVYDFTYGRLRNEHAIAALPYIAERLEGIFGETLEKILYSPSSVKRPMATVAADSDTHILIFQRDKHPSTPEAYLATPEGKKFPHFHSPEGDPGMGIVPELKPFEKCAFAIVDKSCITDPASVRALEAAEAHCGPIDEIHIYGFLAGMCVTGFAIQARANFHYAEIFVHSRGIADCDRPDYHGNMRAAQENKELALLVLGGNFINIVP